jgi:hypothetical protein
MIRQLFATSTQHHDPPIRRPHRPHPVPTLRKLGTLQISEEFLANVGSGGAPIIRKHFAKYINPDILQKSQRTFFGALTADSSRHTCFGE